MVSEPVIFGENIKIQSPTWEENSATVRYGFKVLEDYNKAMVNAVIEHAKQQGITDITLLNGKAIVGAMKRQIPQKVTVKEYDIGPNEYFCSCGNQIGCSFEYCPYCGQALSWDDTP